MYQDSQIPESIGQWLWHTIFLNTEGVKMSGDVIADIFLGK